MLTNMLVLVRSSTQIAHIDTNFDYLHLFKKKNQTILLTNILLSLKTVHVQSYIIKTF